MGQGQVNGKAAGVVLATSTKQRMIPLEGETLGDLVRIALHNIQFFRRDAFETWRLAQSEDLRTLAELRPPDKLWRIITDNERSGRGTPKLYGVVIGYAEGRGEPALCMVYVLGVKTGAGSYEQPVGIPRDALVDVTEEARAGKLQFDP